jgi:hypothetical protein
MVEIGPNLAHAIDVFFGFGFVSGAMFFIYKVVTKDY